MSARTDAPADSVLAAARFKELLTQYDTPGLSVEDGCAAVARAYNQTRAEFGAAFDVWVRSVVGRTDPSEVEALADVEAALALPNVGDRGRALQAVAAQGHGLAGRVAGRLLSEEV